MSWKPYLWVQKMQYWKISNRNYVLAELDDLLNYCKSKDVIEEVITDINVKTLNYVKKCKKQKTSRNIIMTKKYLKENELLAVPFDKGIGICIMKRKAYEDKLSEILHLPQFEKEEISSRKNAKHPALKEHERIIDELKKLKSEGKIDDDLYEKMYPTGSQPARLYGLAKVHKNAVPTRPVLSMPGSAYHKIALQLTEWLAIVPECQINTSTKTIADSLSGITLEEDEEIISFDVSSLYTNVPVYEAISECADLLYSGQHKIPPIDKDTFIELMQLCTCNVQMLTHDGYYRQVDGLAMGVPPAPYLANGWLSKKDRQIMDNAKLKARYMDDIIRSIKASEIEQKLRDINELHPSLKFTMEREVDGLLPFLDMLIQRDNNKLNSTWYTKPTDTGLVMNYHALAPKRYKRSVVSGLVYRLHRACSTWKNFHSSMEKAKFVLEKNQYPPQFYEPLIEQTLSKIVEKQGGKKDTAPQPAQPEDTTPKKMIFLEYRNSSMETQQKIIAEPYKDARHPVIQSSR